MRHRAGGSTRIEVGPTEGLAGSAGLVGGAGDVVLMDPFMLHATSQNVRTIRD